MYENLRIFLQIVTLTATVILQAHSCYSFAITNGHCLKNTSVKYQVPVTKTRLTQLSGNDLLTYTEQYVDYEERTHWDTVRICCPGYRTIIFGFCEPICELSCPQHSYCIAPNKCACMHGYEPTHHTAKRREQQQLICRPVCTGGCPDHSHCVAHNECVCRAGYKDASTWFTSLRCERIQCLATDQRYDVTQHACIKIEMSVEELMQKVGEKLTKGLDVTETSTED